MARLLHCHFEAIPLEASPGRAPHACAGTAIASKEPLMITSYATLGQTKTVMDSPRPQYMIVEKHFLQLCMRQLIEKVRFDEIRDERDDFERENAKLEKRIEELEDYQSEERVKDLEAEIRSLQTEVSEKDTEIDELKKRIEALEAGAAPARAPKRRGRKAEVPA